MRTDTEYANTDFDLKSETAFDTLHRELEAKCSVLHYTHGQDGHWYSIVESICDGDTSTRNAEFDIFSIVNAINTLSPTARAEFNACYLREFNIGFHCWDSWGYVHRIPEKVVKAIAEAGCSIAVTLYPMRDADGKPKI